MHCATSLQAPTAAGVQPSMLTARLLCGRLRTVVANNGARILPAWWLLRPDAASYTLQGKCSGPGFATELGGRMATPGELRRLLGLLTGFPTSGGQDRRLLQVPPQ